MSKFTVRGGLVDCGDGQFRHLDVEVVDGRIASVGEVADRTDHDVDARGMLVVPGTINAHTHSNEGWWHGVFDDLPLETWLQVAYPKVRAVPPTPEEAYLRTAWGAIKMLKAGTTSVVDCLIEPTGLTAEVVAAVAQAYRDVGVRALLCLGVADQAPDIPMDSLPRPIADAIRTLPAESAATQLERVAECAAEYVDPDQGVVIGVAPAGVHRCSDELLQHIAAEDWPVHLHISESPVQVARSYASGSSMVQRAAHLGLLRPHTYLSHAVWVSADDADLIAKSGAGVVHNPVSNLKLGNGIAPIGELLARGIPIALGTDGPSSADGQDLPGALRLAGLLHRRHVDAEAWVTAQDAWAMATTGGAGAMGLAGELGALQQGARADVVLMDLGHPAFVPLGNPVNHLVLGQGFSAVSTVIQGGVVRLSGGRVRGVDEDSVRSSMAEATHRFRERSAAATKFVWDMVPIVEAERMRVLGAGQAWTNYLANGWSSESEMGNS